MAGLGQFGAPGIAREELDAELLFQRLDLMADGGAGDAELAGRQPEAAEPRGGFEGGQSAKRGKIATGQVSSPDEPRQDLYNILKIMAVKWIERRQTCVYW